MRYINCFVLTINLHYSYHRRPYHLLLLIIVVIIIIIIITVLLLLLLIIIIIIAIIIITTRLEPCPLIHGHVFLELGWSHDGLRNHVINNYENIIINIIKLAIPCWLVKMACTNDDEDDDDYHKFIIIIINIIVIIILY